MGTQNIYKNFDGAGKVIIRFIISLFILLFLNSCRCSETVGIPVVSYTPPNFTRVMRGGKKIGVIAAARNQVSMGEFGTDWSPTIQGAATSALVKAGYFQLVDISSRQDRLREIAHSQSGVTQEQKEIGKELQVDGLIYMRVSNQPKYDCSQKTVTKYRQGDCIRSESKQVKQADGKYKTVTKCVEYQQVAYQETYSTGFLTVFLQARLVNVETGEALHFTNNTPYSTTNVGGCPSALELFGYAISSATYRMSQALSPRVTELQVPIDQDPFGSPEETEERVEAQLEQGVKWITVETPNFEQARKSWQRALELSDYKSASAYWNLSVYYWYSGDMDKAAEFMDRAQEFGGPDFIDDRRNIITTFEKEKKRIEAENNPED